MGEYLGTSHTPFVPLVPPDSSGSDSVNVIDIQLSGKGSIPPYDLQHLSKWNECLKTAKPLLILPQMTELEKLFAQLTDFEKLFTQFKAENKLPSSSSLERILTELGEPTSEGLEKLISAKVKVTGLLSKASRSPYNLKIGTEVNGLGAVGGINDNFGMSIQDFAGNIFAFASAIISYMLQTAQYISAIKFTKIQAQNKDAREAQDMANEMDRVIAELAKDDPKARGKIPDDVYNYFKDNGIFIEGMDIDDYIKKYGDSKGLLDKGQMQEIKSTLDNRVSSLTDEMNQGQTQIQQMMQIINAATTQMTNLIDKWGSLMAMVSQKMFAT